ncbi:actin nucleation-promoting factor WASL-like [Artemia franciscana]|uniref:actin nucleation-promoting factor WASL-like n=1 Tax=Artemia franciscana TaxID=6661 RepID=UPI0032D9E31B
MNAQRKFNSENKSSSLLRNDQNDIISRLLGSRCQALSTTVVQVLHSDSATHSRWIKRHCGVACFVRDSQRRSYFIRVYCPDKQIALWEQELYNNFTYKMQRSYFHTFEGDDCMVGLNFVDEEEAHRFHKTIETYLRRKQEKLVIRWFPMNMFKTLMKKMKMKGQYHAAFLKCIALWDAVNKNSKAAAAVKEVHDKQLIRPVVTRWPSKYESVERLMYCNKIGKLADVCDALQKPRLTSRDTEILEEYMKIMKSVAVALDILQGEEKCYFGGIYPTIKSFERKLKKLKDLAKVSQPLVHALLVAKKFEGFRSTYEADKGSFLSGDEYFDLSNEETTHGNSGNRGRESNSVKVLSKGKPRKLRKEDIGAPMNFQHVQHVGWDANRGFALENVDEQLKPFFNLAGITEDQLADSETRNFIYDFISQRGGVEAAMREASKPAPPPVPTRGPATPQVNRSAPPPPARQQAPPPPTRGIVSKPAPKHTAPSIPSSYAVPPAPVAAVAPPPPPPPPLPSGSLITAPAPPPLLTVVPNQPKPTLPPEVQSDSRGALMEAIRGGATLKKVDAPRKGSVDSRGDLLDQIRTGVELKSVPQTDSSSKSSMDENAGLAGALARALAERSRVIQSDSDDGDSSDSAEEDDEWD